MMVNVQIPVSHHCATSIPTTPPQDMNGRDIKSVGGTHHRPDIEIVFPVLNSHMQRGALGVKVGDDGLHRPVAVPINNIASIA